MNEFKMVVERFEDGQKKMAEAIVGITDKLTNLQEQVGHLTEGQMQLQTGQVRLEGRMDKLEAGQARLEAGQSEIKAELKNKVQVEVFEQLVQRVEKHIAA